MTLCQFEHLSVVKTKVWTYPTENCTDKSPALLGFKNICKSESHSLVVYCVNSYAYFDANSNDVSGEFLFQVPPAGLDPHLILDDIQKKSNLKG